MEMNRRIAAGRMAEILGPGALDTDRFLRSLGVRRNAEGILANLPAETRGFLDAYAKGVNAYLGHRKGPLPPEFLLTGAPAPAPWTPVDSVSWQTMMAWDLSGNWTQELLRMRLSQRMSLARINEFMAPYPGAAPLPTQDYTRLYRELSGNTEQLTQIAAIAPPSLVEGKGSNNWVVGGGLSVSGKPLLANDPHLALGAPALWYFAHLSSPAGNVIGATLPGVPGVVLGHNDRIAWGFTNTGPDVQDLYIERVNPDDARQYQTPDGWASFKERIETIKVKGAADVTLTVRETRHGPVITGALPIIGRAPVDTRKYVMAFAWTALRTDDRTLHASMRLMRAKNWDEFVDSVKDFSAPEQNMVYADVDGNIGFIAPARVPVRKAENDLHGLAPAPGWDARYDWDGFIPFDQLPRKFNPPEQRVVTANARIVADDYPFFITSEWAAPFRTNRINDLIAEKAKHDMASFGAIQKDAVSLAAREILPVLTAAPGKSARAKEVIALLTKWDGNMSADRIEPLLYNAWMREASRQIFADELGPALMQDYWSQGTMHRPMLNVLKNVDGQSRWCADAKPQTCAELLGNALEVSLADLDKRYGADMSKWHWGAAHFAQSEHRPFSKVELLAKLFDIRIPVPGDSNTINVGGYTIRDEKEPFASHHGASLRALYDLNDLDNSRFIHSTGQSGNVLSPLYRNFTKRWAEVQYLPMKTKRESVEQNKLGTLTLTP
jgi:penicillin amidase